MKSFLRTFLSLATLLAALTTVSAQNEVTFRLNVGTTEAEAGEQLRVFVNAEISAGWHLYALTAYPEGAIAPQPTQITVEESPAFELAGEVLQPEPHVSHDPNFDINTYYFDDRVDFELPVSVKPDAPDGEHALPVKIRFMACNDRLCLPPQIERLSAQVTVRGGVASGAVAQAQEVNPAVTPVASGNREIPSGAFAYIWFAMLMGGLALLTPCVFPMIPITVSFFTKKDVSRGRAVADAGLYSLGIILTFTLIGFVLTFLFGVGGINRVATNPVVNLAIATIFVVFALSLFGVLELRLPSSWLSAVDKKSSVTGGPVGILLMALTFSLTSFTCTVPFVGTVMVAATQGDWLWSLLGVAAFATVFSAPFFALALFPSMLKALPRSGGWMNSLKITMGFLELAAALKFLSNVDLVYQAEWLTRPVFITIWLAIALVTAGYLLGRFHFPHEAPVTSVGAGRVLSATFFIAVSFYLLRGLFGFPLGELDAFLPPRDYGGVAAFSLTGGESEPREKWLTNYQQALLQAQAKERPLFVDFTGYTCTNCRWMEANIFVLKEVQERFERFVLVRLYTDGTKPEHEENLRFEKERFGTIALPLYAIIDPSGDTIASFPGLTRDPQEFIRFLDAGLESSAPTLAQNLEQ